MILLCEPQCKGSSHEKLNSSFIYGFRLAYPEEKICVFAHTTHIEAIQRMLKGDGITIENIEFKSISFDSGYSPLLFVRYTILLTRLFVFAVRSQVDKIFFLSFNAMTLSIVKNLKVFFVFSKLKIVSVLHGEYETISGSQYQRLQPLDRSSANTQILTTETRSIFSDLSKKCIETIKRLKSKAHLWRKESQRLFSLVFPLKQVLLSKHSDDYRYVALSPHVIENSKSYLDVEKLNLKCVTMPTIFKNTSSKRAATSVNSHVKFAVFGFGYPAMLQKILWELSKLQISKAYEIRMISMDTRGLEGFPHVTLPSPGRFLSREKMENLASDIDVFLMLYTKDQYRLSCSASILEAISLIKPIIHFDNDCFNHFNRPDHPIGVRCQTVEDYAKTLAKMINEYPICREQLQTFRSNLLMCREEFSMSKVSEQIRASMTWDQGSTKFSKGHLL